MTMPSSGPTKNLARLKVSVQHIVGAWADVVQRRHYLRAMSQSDALRAAMSQTYAGNVHNTLHAILSLDLIRAIGSHILDDDKRSVSLDRAVAALRDTRIREQLAIEYGVIQPTRYADETAVEAVRRYRRTEIEEYLVTIPSQLDEIETNLLRTPLAQTMRAIRNKVVAHNDIVHDGSNWTMWRIDGTVLTFGQLDEYIDGCTRAIETLSRLVLRTASALPDVPGISQTYADEYIEALVLGLSRQKELRETRRLENIERTRQLTSGEGKAD